VETDPHVADTSLVVSLSDATLTIFAVEVVLKWVADTGSMRSTFAFLSDGWNAFDVAILLSQVVLVVLLPALDVDSVMDSGHAARALRILRLVRSLRMLRAAKIVPELMLVMETLLRSLSSVGYIMAFTMLVSYVFAIIGVTLFGKNDPFHFGSIHVAMLSLFRIATQEDWTDIMYFNMYGCNGWGDYDAVVEVNTKACEHTSHYVSAPVYFICYIICATFLLLNLFLAVIVNSMMETKEETKLRKQEAKAWAVATRIKVKTDISLKGMGMSGIKAGMGAARKGLAKAGVELGSTPAGQKGFETEAGSSKAKGKKKAKGGAKEFDNPISKLS
jgi:voltage-gated sodium channel